MQSIVSVNPFRCRVWPLHYRLQEHIDENSCKAEIKSFMEHGQLLPALGRRLRNGSDHEHEIELICGARRLFVARHINCSFAVELRDLSDRDAIITMELENAQRQDISVYERGLSYQRWLQGGYFRSQMDIARSLAVSPSQVSRLLRIAALPASIVDAFPRAIDISENWGLQLATTLEEQESRQRVISEALALAGATPRLPADETYKRLLRAATRTKSAGTVRRAVRDSEGLPLFWVKRRQRSVVIELPLEKVSANALASAKELVSGILIDRRGAASKAQQNCDCALASCNCVSD